MEPSDVIVEPEMVTSSAPVTGLPFVSISLTLIEMVSLLSAISYLNGNGIGFPSLIEETTLPALSRPESSSPIIAALTFKFGSSATGLTLTIIFDEVDTALSAPTVVVVQRVSVKSPEKFSSVSSILTPSRSLVVKSQSPVDVFAPLLRDSTSGRPRILIKEVPADGELLRENPISARSVFPASLLKPPSLRPSYFDTLISAASATVSAFESTQKTYSAGVMLDTFEELATAS